MNKVIISGNLVADPELKQTNNGTAYTSFRIGTKRRMQDTSYYHNIVAWKKTAEFVTQYFKKGSAILIVGEIQNRDYTTQNGEKKYITEIVADEVEFFGAKKEEKQEYVHPNVEHLGTDDSELPF